MAVNLTAVSSAILAFADENSDAETYALVFMPIACLFIVYSLATYHWRANKIKNREQLRWDDPFGPIILGVTVTLALIIHFFLQVREMLSVTKST